MYIYYIDPGTGSMLISATIAMFSVAFFVLKGLVYRKFGIGGDKGEMVDLNKNYGLVFYSEGKQYWTTFKSLVEESSKRGVPVTYFTSDKEDPGLTVDLPHVTTQYIGSGREAFYILNRLTCDVMVMTTPGLDVLELKRSPNVKHYCHVTHSTGSIAGYKTYSVDYYDSVLIGGYGDIDVIQELEQLRNLPKKEVEIIGHTYLDALQEEIDKIPADFSFFKEKRPTVLVSPTWGNHGLLMKYGHEILSAIVKSDKYNVIVRPHPQSFISEAEMMDDLMNKFPANDHFVWDREIDNIYAMSQADVMISDFSGIIFDFYSLYQKPILTMSGNYEQRGREVMDLDGLAWDLKMIEKIGGIIHAEDVHDMTSIIDSALESEKQDSGMDNEIMAMYPRESGVRGLDFIERKLEEVKSMIQDNVESISEEFVVDENLSGFSRLMKTLLSPNTIFQLLMGVMFLTVLIFGGSSLLLEGGLNQVLFSLMLPYSVGIIVLLLMLLVISVRLKHNGVLKITKKNEAFNWKNLLLIALPMTPIVQYIISNQDILNASSSMKVFVYFVAISIVMIGIIPWILSSVIEMSLTTSVSMSFLFILFNRAIFGRTTRMAYITFLLAALCLVIFIALSKNKKNIVIIISTVFLIANTGTSFMNREVPEEVAIIDNKESTFVKKIEGLEGVKSPDVFLMTYDAYSNEETWKHYDYDNSDQMEYLLDEGFTIYDGSYSIMAASLPSMSHVLHPEETVYDNTEFRRKISGDAASLEMFRKNDYALKSIFPSDYFTKEVETKYDFAYPGDRFSINPDKIIIDAVLEGEFRFDADFSTLTYDDYLEAKNHQIREKDKKPTFMYFHDNFPGHTQNSGVLLPGERDMIIERLEMANVEMKNNIEALKTRSNDAIIIIVGDHGPYLTKNGSKLDVYDQSEIDQVDVQDRFGTFIAIKWPDEDYEERFDIRLIQDVMPAVAAYIYNDDRLFDELRMERHSKTPSITGGVEIDDDMIVGGKDSGKPLFEKTGVRRPKRGR